MRQTGLMIRGCIASLLLIGVFLGGSEAQEAPLRKNASSGESLEFKEKSIILENIYTVKVAKYEPSITVIMHDRAAADYATPESSAITQFSAMHKLDYDWWLEGWTEASKIFMKQRDAELKRSPDDWKQRWQGALKNKSVRLTYRADYFRDRELYALIGYKLVGKDEKQKEFEGVLNFKRVGFKWLADQDLKEDVVFNNILQLWHSDEPSVRIQKKMN